MTKKPMRRNRRLLTYWNGMTMAQRAAFCKAIGTTYNSFKQVIYGRRSISVEVAARIEQATLREENPIDRAELYPVCRACSYVRIVRTMK
jgi:DNA-binding transcriptional regulator YdaS (Cro superfamily)